MKCGRRGCEDYSASPMRWVAALMVCSLSTAHAGEPPTSRPPATSTTESSRLGVEYLVQKAGTTWVYQLEGQAKARGRLTIIRLADWRAHFSYGFGKQSGSEALVCALGCVARANQYARPSRGGGAPGADEPWLDVEGARLNRTRRRRGRAVRGDGAGRHRRAAERQHLGPLPGGAGDGARWQRGVEPLLRPPSLGKVAVRSPRGWVYRLVEFRSGSKHAE